MPDNSNNPFQFWEELKRRKVTRVIIVFAAAAYVILELTSIIAEPFGLPDWTLKLVFVLLTIGFIIAIILSWIYDITPEGVEKTKPVKEVKKEGKPVTSNIWKIATYISVIIIVALIIFNIVRSHEQAGRMEKTEKSIAVLPFKNLSGNSEQVYFVEGMHEELITGLSKIKTLKVISRTSVVQYKNTEKSMPEIARELNVDVLIEGSVLRVGDQVRINAQLIDGSTDKHLWAEHYDRELQDVLGMISEVAQNIAHEIKIVLTPLEKERLTNIYSVNPIAQEYYMQGRFYFNTMTVKNYWKASEYFQKAIDADINFAKAYVRLADCYGVLTFYGEIPHSESSLKFTHLLDKAFRLDNQLADAHQALATWKFYLEYDWQGAGREFKRALDLNPSLVGNNEYAYYLMAMRRFDEAIAEAKRVLRLDPFTMLSSVTLAFVYSVAGRNNESIEQYQRILELGLSDNVAYHGLKTAYRRMGRYDEAVKAYQELMALWGSSPEVIESLGQAYKESGSQGYWLWFLKQSEGKYNEQPLTTAKYYAQLGEKEQALTYLEMAYQKRHRMLYMLYADPDWAHLRDEPRFQALIKKMGFEE